MIKIEKLKKNETELRDRYISIKNWFKEIRGLSQRIKILEQIIASLKDQVQKTATTLSPTAGVSGGQRKDFSDTVADILALQTVYKQQLKKLLDKRAEAVRWIELLPVHYQQVFNLYYLEGLSAYKTANKVGYSEIGVKKQLYEGKIFLAKNKKCILFYTS